LNNHGERGNETAPKPDRRIERKEGEASEPPFKKKKGFEYERKLANWGVNVF